MLSSAVLALFLASPFAIAQRLRLSPNGCLLDKSEDVVAKINCGRKSTITFAIERYGANEQELQTWLGVAGCSEDEAMAEARWAATRCQVHRPTETNLELRHQPKDTRQLAGKRNVQLGRRAGTPENKRPIKRDDTVASSTSTSPNPASTSNTWVLIQTTSGALTTKTCATEHSFTQTSCTSSIHAGKMTKSCTSAPTETMSCLSGFSCSFATDTGNFTCFEKQGVPVYGWIIAGVLGLAVLFAIAAITFKCCRQRRLDQKRKLLKENMALKSMDSAKSMGVVVTQVGETAPTVPANISDTIPLMAPEYPPGIQTPGYAHYGQAPEIMVEDRIYAGEHVSRNNQEGYSPFRDPL